MDTDLFHNLVIGSGESGKYLAWALAKAGQRTAVIERSMIGGSCPNIACLPTKNVIRSAKVASFVQRAREFGISTGEVHVDMAGVIARKRQMVEDLVTIQRQRYLDTGVELIMGEARFIAPLTVHITLPSGGVRLIQGARVFVNVGTHTSLPDIPGLAESRPMTHVEALNLQYVPRHLVILGGGFVGLEFAQAMRRFGSEVTIIHRGEQLLSNEDADVSIALRQILEREGITVCLQSSLEKVTGISGERLQLEVQDADGPQSLDATDLLVATGRTPNTANLDANWGGIELDARGYIRVNDRLETSAPNTWAMGECAGSPQFTHVAFDDYRIVHDNLYGGSRSTRDRLIPCCLFTDPELARVGLSEREARSRDIAYRVATMPMKSVLRTRTISEAEGFAKALIGVDDRILGFVALGAEASELLAAVQTAMLGGMPYPTLRDGIYTHPTISEGLVQLFGSPLKEVAKDARKTRDHPVGAALV